MKKMVRGELTVFLSFIFLLLLSLIGAVLESASLQVLKNEKRADAGRAAESVFAEYQKELLEQYGIFAVEGSYESGNMSESNILNRLSWYGAENMETEIEAIRYLTDNSGMEFFRQAAEYERVKTGAAAAEDILGNLSVWKEQNARSEEYGKENTETSHELEQMLQEEGQELPQEDNPLEEVSRVRAGRLLDIVLPEGFELSQKRAELVRAASSRQLCTGHGVLEERKAGTADTIFFNLYITERFGNAVHLLENTELRYELEYLLAGKDSDIENLEAAVKKICNFRFAANYVYLLTDTQKKAEAEAMAATLCVLLALPGITEVVKQALLLAWAYGEAVMDVRTLLAGKKISLIKTKESWQLSLDHLVSLEDAVSENDGIESSDGYSYEKYLQMMLLLEKKEQLAMRSLDLIEWNMRSRCGMEWFRADACITGARFYAVCPLRRGIEYEFTTTYQYR